MPIDLMALRKVIYRIQLALKKNCSENVIVIIIIKHLRSHRILNNVIQSANTNNRFGSFFFVASILCGFGICCKIREFKCILFVNFLRVISCIREWQNFREVLCFFKPIDERNRIVSVSNHLLITLGTLFVH